MMTDLADLFRANQAQYEAARSAGDHHGESNRALRRMIAECRGALCEMDELADADLPYGVVMMRRQVRESIARAREVLRPMDEAVQLEVDEYRREKERLVGVRDPEGEDL